MMVHSILLSDEELTELDELLRGEITRGHQELRRTRNPRFRDGVRHHVELMERIHQMAESAGASQPTP
jgi:hypothetical protein